MGLKLKNHRIEGIDFVKARWTGDAIVPIIIVCHDTASRLSALSAARYLATNDRKVSVQFVVERDGSAQQQVPTNRRANHAGASTYHGRKYCNGFSIGIEIVNPGIMKDAGNGKALAWWGELFDIEEYGIIEMTTKEHGHGLFMPYTPEQIAMVENICVACIDGYNDIIDITTHWYISPGRKVDTNPLFPLAQIKSRAFGRDDLADKQANDMADSKSKYLEGNDFVRISVPGGDTLNVRRWPSFNPNVIGEVPTGIDVPVLKRGEFDGRYWVKIFHGGQEGWIVERFTTQV